MDMAAKVHFNIFLDPLYNSADKLPAPAFMQTEPIVNIQPVLNQLSMASRRERGHFLLYTSMCSQHLVLHRGLIYIFRLNILIPCSMSNIM